MGQEHGKPSVDKGSEEYRRDQERMHHVTTKGDVQRSVPSYQLEADRLSSALAALEVSPPLIPVTAESHFINKKDKMMDDVTRNSATLARECLPIDAFVKLLATSQTVDLREATVAVKRQEEISSRMQHLNFLTNNLRYHSSQASHDAHVLREQLVQESDVLSRQVGETTALLTDLSPLALGVDSMLTPDERDEVQIATAYAMSKKTSSERSMASQSSRSNHAYYR